MAHMSHAYPDGCSIYFTFVGASPSDHEALERYDATWRAALRAAHRAGGTIAHHHGVGRAKARRDGARVGRGAALDRGPPRRGGPARGDGAGRAAGRDAAVIARARAPRRGARSTRPRGCSGAPRRGAALDRAGARAGAGGFSLPLPDAPTVREALTRALAVDARDPTDHLVAGYAGRLPDGAAAWWLPCPRRAAGPDVLSMVLRDSRFGSIDAVALRVVGGDEAGPRELAPTVTLDARRSASLDAWTERAATRGGA